MPVNQQTQQDMAAYYGWSLAVLRSSPDLSALFSRAISQGYSGPRFIAELRDTKWYKTHSEAVRKSEVLRRADPAEWNRRREQSRAALGQMYYQLTGRKASGVTWWKFADHALTYGYNEAETRDLVGRMVQSQKLMTTGAGLGGSLGEAERQLRQAAEDWGLPFSDTAIARQLNAIATQQYDTTATIAYYRRQAMKKYQAFAEELGTGMTIKDIAEPYRQLMARTLEISDKGISTNDAAIQHALTYRPLQGQKVGPQTGMSLTQFEETLRNDPRWMKTQNAQDQIMAVGHKVLQDMGFVGAGS